MLNITTRRIFLQNKEQRGEDENENRIADLTARQKQLMMTFIYDRVERTPPPPPLSLCVTESILGLLFAGVQYCGCNFALKFKLRSSLYHDIDNNHYCLYFVTLTAQKQWQNVCSFMLTSVLLQYLLVVKLKSEASHII